MARKMRLRDLEKMVGEVQVLMRPENQRTVRFGANRYRIVPIEVEDVEALLKAVNTLIDLRTRMDQTLRPCG